MSAQPMTVRFAPSPTGTLHLGNARTALFNFILAKKFGAKMILRIEDTDKARSTKESEASIVADLKWLGIGWDYGPDVGGPTPPYRQSECDAYYATLFEQLQREHKIYPCFCTAADLEADRERQKADGSGVLGYVGRCRALAIAEADRRRAAGEHHVWRLKFPEDRREVKFNDVVRGEVAFPLTNLGGDMVLFRADGSPIFHFAVVADDHRMGVTLALRGEDHLANTPKQIMLYEALGWTPPQFGHMAMILGPDKTKLSKRHGGVSVDYYRAMGLLPEALFNYLSLLGWSPGDDTEVMSPGEIIERFSLERLIKSAAVFDEKKLLWLNGMHLRALTPSVFADRALQWLQQFAPQIVQQCGSALLAQVLPIYRDAIESFSALPQELTIFAGADLAPAEQIRPVSAYASFAPVLTWFAERIDSLPPPGPDRDVWLKAAEAELQTSSGAKGKQLFQPLRLIISGRVSGRALPDVLRYMPLDLIKKRIALLKELSPL